MHHYKNLNAFQSLFSKIHLSTTTIRKYARLCEFEKRTARKIHPELFLSLFLKESMNANPSYNDLAARLESDTGISASKQAICQRVNDCCVEFMKAILSHIMNMRFNEKLNLRKSGYGRILIQDSTIIRLPTRLLEEFSGVGSSGQKACNARIQVIYDLKNGDFISFSIDPYSKNDLTSACELELKKNDLILRDRGYLTASEIQRHVDMQADCIYRHKNRFSYIDPQTGELLDLLSLLENQGSVDKEVFLNNDEKTVCRIVAAPVNEETANIRRMKLKKESKGHKPSRQNLRLMSWTIFITTIPKSKMSFNELIRIYGLRWRIEVLFKTWKSNMNFASIHNVSKLQLQVLLAARFMTIVLITQAIFKPLHVCIKEKYNKQISLVKTTRYLVKNKCKINRIIEFLYSKNNNDEEVLDIMSRYCTYDKRKRISFNDEFEAIINSGLA